MTPLLASAPDGLLCADGGFHVDPWRPVPLAVVTHAHGDHATRGCGAYLCSVDALPVMRARLGDDARIETLAYGEPRLIGRVRVALHPSGHVLGSAQVRLERGGETWCVSGDYKLAPDPTCAAFAPVRCDVFVTESTFALPIYRWRPAEEVARGIESWWRANAERGRTSVLFAYALGKAQRVLALIDPSLGPILAHGAVRRMNDAYAAAGVALSPTLASADSAQVRGRGLVIAPPYTANSLWLRRFGALSTALASGWMRVRGARRWRNLDRGFVLSDHADWDGLNAAVAASGASRVLVTHGQVATFVRWLSERGVDAQPLATPYVDELTAATTPAEEEMSGAEA